jgi:xanthine dehydrogenase accessory factor
VISGELAARVATLSSERRPFVVATVVRAARPTSVRPGFSALVLADGTIEGFVGGTCAESSVRLHALRALETGEPMLLRIVPGDEVNLEANLGEVAGPFADAIVEHNPCLSGGALEIFLEPQLPARRLIVVGDTPIARALRMIAGAAGFSLSSDAAPAPDDAAVIVASQGSQEEEVLSAALGAGVPYVALVASRVRGQAVRESLDVPAELSTRLHTPAGLDIGARGPEEIAISILAELIAEHHAHPEALISADDPRVRSSIDPVCGMEVAVSDATPFLDAADGRIFFCGTGCRDAYAAQHA